MRLPRITVRRLAAFVALAGLGLGAWGWMARRSAALRSAAREHERIYKTLVGGNDVFPGDPATIHHRRLAEKYRRAARRPWLPVEPDPPGPG